MKKFYIITSFIIVLLVSFLGVTYSYEYNENESLMFELVGPYEIDIELNDNYYEYGVKVVRNGEDISNLININKSSLDTSKVGNYKVKYELLLDGNIEYIYRIVNVREYVKPQIILKGDEIVYLSLNDTYVEMGYEVIDNYDVGLNKKVSISGKVDTSIAGEYELLYSTVDSSGNMGSVKRLVIVKDSETKFDFVYDNG